MYSAQCYRKYSHRSIVLLSTPPYSRTPPFTFVLLFFKDLKYLTLAAKCDFNLNKFNSLQIECNFGTTFIFQTVVKKGIPLFLVCFCFSLASCNFHQSVRYLFYCYLRLWFGGSVFLFEFREFLCIVQ